MSSKTFDLEFFSSEKNLNLKCDVTLFLSGNYNQYRLKLPSLFQFDGFQKDAIQMVKPAKGGTTTLAFIFKEGVMVAADSRPSMGGYICMVFLSCLDSLSGSYIYAVDCFMSGVVYHWNGPYGCNISSIFP